MSTNQQLSEIITSFNKGNYKTHIKISLSLWVDYVKFVKTKEFNINSTESSICWKEIFLLKHENKYVGIIENLGHDLHIYIKKQYRKKTNLLKELNDTILPYLFLKKDKQYLTFINKKVEQYFLNNLKNIQKLKSLTAVVKKEQCICDKNKVHHFDTLSFEQFKKRVVKKIQLENKIDRLISNDLAKNYLKREPFLNESDYRVLTNEEKIGFSKEDFDIVVKYYNYMKKLKNFYNEELIVCYGQEKQDNFYDYIFDKSIKEIKAISLVEFEQI